MRTVAVLLVVLGGCKKKPEAVSQGSGSAVVVAVPRDAGIDAMPDAAIDAAPPLGEKVLDEETIGGIAIGASDADVVKVLGPPESKTPLEEEEATLENVTKWRWKGVDVEFAQRDGKLGVRSIHVMPPSTLATSRGITIGSAKTEVEQRYTKSTETESGSADYLVGSPYGGELFTFKDGKVSEIFLGPMAE